jgi:Co/Zn/Cd efflux system component
MHTEDLSRWTHEHRFDSGNAAAERSTRVVMWITAAMMVVEIVAGWWFNSMALLADGWHMSSHAVAIGLSAAAYALARRHAQDPRFAFGTWKIEILGGFASAIFLLGVAALMVVGSVERILSPAPIHYQEAIVVAVLGLVVNIVCALILGQAHHHGHDHGHGHGHGHHHGHAWPRRPRPPRPQPEVGLCARHRRCGHLGAGHRGAGGRLALGLVLAGPADGPGGRGAGGVWAKGLVVDTAKVLLDREMDHPVVEEIREVVEADAGTGDSRLADLHVWRVGQGAYACALTVVTHDRSSRRRRAPAPVGARGGGAQHHRDPPLPGSSLKQAGQSGAVRRPGHQKPLICQAILILMSRAPQSASAQVLPLPGDKPAMPLPSSPATPPVGAV